MEGGVTTPSQRVRRLATVGVGPLKSGPVTGDAARGAYHEAGILHAGVHRVGRSLHDGHLATAPLGRQLLVQGDALCRETLLVWRQQVAVGRGVGETLAVGVACEGSNVTAGHVTLLVVGLGRADRVVCDVLVEAAVDHAVVRVVLPPLNELGGAGAGRRARSGYCLALSLRAADVRGSERRQRSADGQAEEAGDGQRDGGDNRSSCTAVVVAVGGCLESEQTNADDDPVGPPRRSAQLERQHCCERSGRNEPVGVVLREPHDEGAHDQQEQKDSQEHEDTPIRLVVEGLASSAVASRTRRSAS